MFGRCVNIPSSEYPRQLDFSVISEDFGKTLLSDDTVIETKFVLSDLVMHSEDVVGADISFSGVVALRTKSTKELKEKVEDKPISDKPIPPTAEAGYEPISIKGIEKPTISSYKFEDRILTVKLEISAVARNLRYRVPSGAPVYYVRWNLNASIKKVQEQS